ncbi:SDR family oxidoreductase [Ellagibacter isourolithinifaciens]|uniref:SDR family oxidoreductase n=1 Tax=Ellagibacter isourolithinifaciens TaxID=2137581 RepID=UPI0023F33CA7|nr:NAD(P)-dependent oxidoreductase [Ellagibacter isourolithinifaciens]MDD5926109.1 NAD(P)-dependent oxidoreductase [Ellagibacter isourolithinifaciens]
MKILITGANGQLGTELQRVLREMRAEIGPLPADYRGAEVVALGSGELDITDENAVASELAKGYDIVINAAAYTNVDGCESNTEDADAVNHLGPAHLARACEEHGTKLVQVSTDYVFPGNNEGERVETDPVGPISAYGRTKLAGEEAVKELCSRYFIVRTAWLYGYKGKKFAMTRFRLASKFG